MGSLRTCALVLVLGFAGCQSGWDDRPVIDDDDDSTFPVQDDDDTSPGDDDDTTPGDDDDTTPGDDDDSGDDDDTTGDDDDSGDDDDTTGDDDDSGDDDDTTGDDDDSTPDPDDADGDGYDATSAGGDDCDDTDAAVNPGAIEDPSNSIDDDCDGQVDEAGSIATVSPPDGISPGGTLVTVTGEGFLAVTGATLGGQTVTPQIDSDAQFTFVAPGGSVGDVDLVVITQFETLTVTDAFRYTGTASTLDGCALVGPASTSGALGVDQGPYTATATHAGLTGAGSEPAGLLGQIGYGTQGQLPTTWPDYVWSDATWSQSAGSADEYTATVAPHTYGTWMVLFRFSLDGGYEWLYCDTDGSTPLNITEMSQATVTPPSP